MAYMLDGDLSFSHAKIQALDDTDAYDVGYESHGALIENKVNDYVIEL